MTDTGNTTNPEEAIAYEIPPNCILREIFEKEIAAGNSRNPDCTQLKHEFRYTRESTEPKSLLDGIDLSVYLVTDSGLNHPSRTLIQTIEDAILGGVRIVQLREKNLNTEDFIKLAKEVHEVTRRHNVPLLINDNIDVVLATDAEGIHIGQDDMPCIEARQRLGSTKIIGVSVETPSQAVVAAEDGADYIGIQMCYKTDTKISGAPILGHIGVRSILEALPHARIKSIGIGGITVENAQRLVRSSRKHDGPRGSLDGVAVVTAIVSAFDAKAATARLLDEVIAGKTVIEEGGRAVASVQEVIKSVPGLLTTLRQNCPLTHHITNYVVMNETANCTLAIGGSPIMAPDATEAKDLSKVVSSVVLNIGTLTEPVVECMIEAGKHANAQSKPVILDPVGAGATTLRRETAKRILNSVHVDIIKGNCGEISALAEIVGSVVQEEVVRMRGVDAVGEGFSNPARVVQALAKREHCVVAMTGKIDYISDGTRTVAIENGHNYQGKITGSGCMVAAIVASFAGISPEDHFAAAVAGILCTNLAGEHAGRRDDVRGPGTFRAAFHDELANLNPATIFAEFKVKEV